MLSDERIKEIAEQILLVTDETSMQAQEEGIISAIKQAIAENEEKEMTPLEKVIRTGCSATDIHLNRIFLGQYNK